jgi:hypothetical protein
MTSSNPPSSSVISCADRQQKLINYNVQSITSMLTALTDASAVIKGLLPYNEYVMYVKSFHEAVNSLKLNTMVDPSIFDKNINGVHSLIYSEPAITPDMEEGDLADEDPQPTGDLGKQSSYLLLDNLLCELLLSLNLFIDFLNMPGNDMVIYKFLFNLRHVLSKINYSYYNFVTYDRTMTIVTHLFDDIQNQMNASKFIMRSYARRMELWSGPMNMHRQKKYLKEVKGKMNRHSKKSQKGGDGTITTSTMSTPYSPDASVSQVVTLPQAPVAAQPSVTTTTVTAANAAPVGPVMGVFQTACDKINTDCKSSCVGKASKIAKCGKACSKTFNKCIPKAIKADAKAEKERIRTLKGPSANQQKLADFFTQKAQEVAGQAISEGEQYATQQLSQLQSKGSATNVKTTTTTTPTSIPAPMPGGARFGSKTKAFFQNMGDRRKSKPTTNSNTVRAHLVSGPIVHKVAKN